MTTDAGAPASVQSVDHAQAQDRPEEAIPTGPWAMILVLLLAATAYMDSLGYQFIWDDVLMVVQSPKLRDLRNLPEFLRADFTTLTSGAIEGHYYRPTLALTLALDATLWGIRPAFFHLTNVLLHLAVIFLVARLAAAMGAGRNVAVLAALIFALHPVHVEAVVWIAARQEMLLSLGVLGCLLAYRRWVASERGRIGWGLAAIGGQILALLSKEIAVIVPALLLAGDALLPARPDSSSDHTRWRRALIRSLPFWVLSGAFVTFRFSALMQLAGSDPHGLNLWRRVPGSLETLARYLGLLLVPAQMQATYALSRPGSVLQFWPALGLALLVFLVLLLLRWRRRIPLAAFGIVWFLITVIPVLDLVPLSIREMGLTDRYLYLPSVGVCLLLALLLAAQLRPATSDIGRIRIRAGRAALVLLLVLYPWSLLRYASVWRNDLTLYGHMTEVAPNSPSAHLNLGLALLRANDLPGGTRALEQSIRLDPHLIRPRAILALAYVLQGRTHEGFRLFDALAAEGVRERHYYIARIMAQAFAGEPHAAVATAEEGARRFPDDAELTLRWADALERADRPAEAIEKYRQALRLQPGFVQAEEALGYLQARAGRTAEARQHFLRAAEMRPDRMQPIRGLALLSEAQGNRTESLRLWRQVLELASRGLAVQEALDHIRRLERETEGPPRPAERPIP